MSCWTSWRSWRKKAWRGICLRYLLLQTHFPIKSLVACQLSVSGFFECGSLSISVVTPLCIGHAYSAATCILVCSLCETYLCVALMVENTIFLYFHGLFSWGTNMVTCILILAFSLFHPSHRGAKSQGQRRRRIGCSGWMGQLVQCEQCTNICTFNSCACSCSNAPALLYFLQNTVCTKFIAHCWACYVAQ